MANQPLLQAAGLALDEARQCVVRGSETISLSAAEFRLLRCFLLHPGQILSKTRLNDHLYDGESERDSNVIEVHVNHLRRKLGREVIETRRGQAIAWAVSIEVHPGPPQSRAGGHSAGGGLVLVLGAPGWWTMPCAAIWRPGCAARRKICSPPWLRGPHGLQLDEGRLGSLYTRPLSGRYFLIEIPALDIRWRSRSLWDAQLEAPPRSGLSETLADGPSGQRLLTYRADYQRYGQTVRSWWPRTTTRC